MGGCVLVSDSSIRVYQSIFRYNHATCGGSLSLIDSILLLLESEFSYDRAYYLAGSIQSVSRCLSDTPCFNQIADTNFTQCSSLVYFGAVSFEKISDVYVNHCNFFDNFALSAGGAISFVNCIAFLSYCNLIGNHVGFASGDVIDEVEEHKEMVNQVQKEFSLNNKFGLDKGNPKKSPLYASGGGAIFFKSTEEPDYWMYKPYNELFVSHCCFILNYVSGMIDKNQYSPKWRGMDILFSGHTFFRSYFSYFQIKEDKDSLAPSSDDELFNEDNYNVFYAAREANDGKCNIYRPFSYSYSTKKDFKYSVIHSTSETTKEVTSGYNIYTDDKIIVPDATYEITLPSTRLPLPTTRSHGLTTVTHAREYSFTTLQSPTPRHTKTPTCSTYSYHVDKPLPKTRSWLTPHYFEPFSWEPSASPNATRTHVGDIWPTQTASTPGGHGTPTCSTGKGETPIATASRSWWGEIPPPIPTPSISFQGEHSRSPTPSRTVHGDTWPTQSPLPKILPTKTIDNGINATQSWWGESPNPPPTPSISFNKVPDPTPSQSDPPTPGQGEKVEASISRSNTITMVKSKTQSAFFSQMLTQSEFMIQSYVQFDGSYSLTDLLTVGTVSTMVVKYSVIPFYFASESQLDVEVLVIKTKYVQQQIIDSTVLLIIVVVVMALVFGGILLWFWLHKRSVAEKATRIEDLDWEDSSEVEYVLNSKAEDIEETLDIAVEDLDHHGNDDMWL